jgi:hypothetical protein
MMESFPGTVAGLLDVHKKAVVVVVLESDYPDETDAEAAIRTTPFGLNELIALLRQHGVTHAAMESTAQYWRPVWMAMEGEFTLTLAQARSTRAPCGRKREKPMRSGLRNACCRAIWPRPEQRDSLARQDAIERLCEIPGVGVRTAQHIVAETGPAADVFASAGKLAS